MIQTEFKVGDRVYVTATATGLGVDIPGVISGIEVFCDRTFISILYDRLQPSGRGIIIRNPGLIYKIPRNE